jgi:hypothetical protein
MSCHLQAVLICLRPKAPQPGDCAFALHANRTNHCYLIFLQILHSADDNNARYFPQLPKLLLRGYAHSQGLLSPRLLNFFNYWRLLKTS